MRSMWNGAITFGMVTIPVKLYVSSEGKDIDFKQVDRSDGAPIRFRRVNSATGQEVSYDEVAKGYPLPDGRMIVLTEDDMDGLNLASRKTIKVEQFTEAAGISPLLHSGQKSYYVAPDEIGRHAYALLRGALLDSGLVAVVKVMLRSRERLALLRAEENLIILDVLNWPDEVRAPELPNLGEAEVSPAESKFARSLVTAMTAKFDPAKFTDGYREALAALVEAKINSTTPAAQPKRAQQPAPGDLAAQLQASLRAVRKARTTKPGTRK